jgi:cytochrome P450
MTSTSTSTASAPTSAQTSVRVAHLQGLEVARVLQASRRSFVGEQVRLMNHVGDLVHLGWPLGGWLAFHPRALEHVLGKNALNYVKSQNYAEIVPVMGNGLVTSSGETWTKSRKVVGAEMSREAARVAGAHFARFLSDETSTGVGGWAEEGVVDVCARFTDLAFRFMATALLGPGAAPHCAYVHDRIGVWERRFIRRVYSVVKFPDSWPTPEAVRSRRGIADIDTLVDRLITERVARGLDPAGGVGVGGEMAVVDKLMTAWTNADGTVNRRQVRDEIMTLLLTGHDTTAAAMTWILYVLARHPELQEQAREEARVHERADGLGWLRQIVDETLRVYPVAPGFSRMAIADDVVCGVAIAAGTKVELSAYATHRHPDFWPEPERFDPHRFDAERTIDPFAYVPFGKGPRTCVGKDLALQQLVLGTAALLRRLRFDLVDDAPPAPFATITLKPKGGLRLRVTRVSP